MHLYGPFPNVLFDEVNQDIVGVSFDDQGKVKNVHLSMDKPILSSGKYSPGLERDGRETFVSFPADFHGNRHCVAAHRLKIIFKAVGFILATKMLLDQGFVGL